MNNTTLSPNMNLPVPTVGEDPGPDYATNLDACFSILDQHTHNLGSGIPITPDGLNISSDLTFQGNNGTSYRSVRFNSQPSPLANADDLGCIYEVLGDLYYNSGGGAAVQITSGNSIVGAAGTITGLPSGTAAALYSAGTFTFNSATNTPANLIIGPIIQGTNTASPKTITFSPSGAQAANYNLTWPAAAPASGQILISDGSGNFSWQTDVIGRMPLGSVIATFPNLSGAYTTSATTAADTNGFVLCAGQTISDGSSPMNGVVIPNLSAGRFLFGNDTSGSIGGVSAITLDNTTLPPHTHTFSSTSNFAKDDHSHNISHDHQSGYFISGASGAFYASSSSSASTAGWTTGVTQFMNDVTYNNGVSQGVQFVQTTGQSYTSGALNPPSGTLGTALSGAPNSTAAASGTTGSTGSGTQFSIIPPYFTTVFLMRIK